MPARPRTLKCLKHSSEETPIVVNFQKQGSIDFFVPLTIGADNSGSGMYFPGSSKLVEKSVGYLQEYTNQSLDKHTL